MEARVLGADKRKYGTLAGYFDAKPIDALVTAVSAADQLPGANVYVTINPVMSCLLARADCRLKRHVKVATTDDQVVRRQWLPIDLDPIRPSDIPATDAEHDAAQ